jgi:hypothetical protein
MTSVASYGKCKVSAKLYCYSIISYSHWRRIESNAQFNKGKVAFPNQRLTLHGWKSAFTVVYLPYQRPLVLLWRWPGDLSGRQTNGTYLFLKQGIFSEHPTAYFFKKLIQVLLLQNIILRPTVPQPWNKSTPQSFSLSEHSPNHYYWHCEPISTWSSIYVAFLARLNHCTRPISKDT